MNDNNNNNNNNNKSNTLSPDTILAVFIAIVGIVIIFSSIVSALPNGAGVTYVNSSGPTGGNASSSNISAIAGNMTELIIDVGAAGGSSSQTWQGYYGNVTGGMMLDDGNSNNFYNWSSVAPLGEVFASINSSIIWTNIQCFNFTANGSYADDSANRGNTSLYGMNASTVNAFYGISNDDADAINATFNNYSHSQFYVNNLQFSANECQSIKILNSTGVGVFEEVLLYSPDNRNLVFTSIIKQDTIGFDGRQHDFEMLVLENGHGIDTNSTSYYFYVEIG